MRRKKDTAKPNYTVRENFIYILRELLKCSPIMLVCLIIEIVAYCVMLLCATLTEKYVVDLALGTSDRLRLAIICGVLIVLERLADIIGNDSKDYRLYYGNFKLLCYMKNKVFWKSMNTDYENNESAANSDALNKAKTGSDYIVTQTINTMRNFISAALNILTFSAILSMLNPIIVAIIVLPTMTEFYIDVRKNRWTWKNIGNWQRFDRELNYVQSAASSFSMAKDVRIYGMKGWICQRFEDSFKKRLYWHKAEDSWSVKHNVLSAIIQAAMYMASYAYVIIATVKGSISAGSFVLYFESILVVSDGVFNLLNSYSGFKWLSENVGYSRDYIGMEEHTNRGEGALIPSGEIEIEFKNVSYCYNGADKPTIDNISFTLHKGERLALVGLNGAGKTTLIMLMCGLYNPTSGEIKVNGKTANEYNREEYFNLFSAVFQDISRLPVSIAQNISAQTDENTDYKKVDRCLKSAGFFDDVKGLTQGVNTRLVKSIYDNATELSGGQSQKLALSKALYKDASVLLLDEPTAALDPISEQEMYLNYAEFSKGKSSVFISHRLASTRFCDRIILIENGKIAEEGSHEALMKQGGKYAQLFELQSSYYKQKEGEDFDE
ncbi:MAG: ABC transporter ATP-binding protein/permease [Ruminococcus sp.]|nr:ABC transporter ATP-binding protein/permease [Ruminococcus sp.]